MCGPDRETMRHLELQCVVMFDARWAVPHRLRRLALDTTSCGSASCGPARAGVCTSAHLDSTPFANNGMCGAGIGHCFASPLQLCHTVRSCDEGSEGFGESGEQLHSETRSRPFRRTVSYASIPSSLCTIRRMWRRHNFARHVHLKTHGQCFFHGPGAHAGEILDHDNIFAIACRLGRVHSVIY